MTKEYSVSDLFELESKFKKVKFKYNGNNYNTFYHKEDKTPQIKNLSTQEKGVKFSSFIYGIREDLKIEQPETKVSIETVPTPLPSTIDKLTDISKYITSVSEELPQPFLELMQLPFGSEYRQHQNIKMLDFSALEQDHFQAYKIKKTIPILYFQNEDSVNVRYKWNGSKKIDGWYTLSDIYSRGAFFEADKKASTLIMLEGLKDGINGNIVMGSNCDILTVDSKNSTYDFRLIPEFSLGKYKTILFVQDNKVTEKEMLRMIQGVVGENQALNKSLKHGLGIGAVLDSHEDVLKFYKKIRFYDSENYNNKITDFTDTLESFNLTNAMLKRTALKRLKDNCSNERFINIYNREEIKLIDSYLELYMNTSNVEKFMFYTFKKISFGGDIEREFKYYMNKLVQPPKGHTVLHLDKSKYLSQKSKEIADFFKTDSHVLVGSPTGTGKSNVVQGIVKDEFYKKDKDNKRELMTTIEVKDLLKEQGKDFIVDNVLTEGLPLHFSNIIFLVPLVDLAVEAGQHPLYTHVENSKNHGELGANLDQNYIVLTTDAFESMRTAPLTKEMMSQRIKQAELIVFDEQHYPYGVDGFRGLVTSSYAFLERYKGNVLYLSGTPIYSEASHAHAVVSVLKNEFKSKIDFYIDPFIDEKEVLKNMKNNLEKGSILFYCKSTNEASRVHNVLNEEGYNVVKITSKEYLMNGKKITKEDVSRLNGKIAYVATTKITTGANLANLGAIYQHGTAFDPLTFVQLTARLRNGGEYYLLKVRNDKTKKGNIQNQAIFICNMAKKFNIQKMSEIWENEEFKKFVKRNIESSYEKNNLRGFLNNYRDSLQLIQSESLGALSRDRADFEFSYSPKENYNDIPKTKISSLDGQQIKNIFVGADSVNYRKFFEKTIIDYIVQTGKVEIINTMFELSFDYVLRNSVRWEDAKGKEFITIEDDHERIKKKNEKDSINEEFKNELEEKFGDIVPIKLLNKYINATARNKLLNDERLDRVKDRDRLIKKATSDIERGKGIKGVITALQCYLIDPKKIIHTILEDIKQNEYTTLSRVSILIEQKDYLSTRKSEGIFVDFLKDFFIDDAFDNKSFKYTIRSKKIKGKLIRNSITIPKEKLKELKQIKQKEEREKARLIYLNEQRKKLESYYDVVTTNRRELYFDSDIEKMEQALKSANFEPKKEPTVQEQVQELERTIADDNILLEARAKAMQQLAILEE